MGPAPLGGSFSTDSRPPPKPTPSQGKEGKKTAKKERRLTAAFHAGEINKKEQITYDPRCTYA